MNNYFRILESTPTTNLRDWTNSGVIDDVAVKSIPDSVVTGNGAKSGTSIPSPLARMYLFDTAFMMMKETNNGNITYKHDGSTMYHVLVSQCLDMMELIYAHASELVFKRWDISGELQKLKESQCQEHKRFARSLDKAFQALNDTINTGNNGNNISFSSVYLVFYRDVLVGGTSPLTAVFVSPNLARDLKEKGLVGLKGVSNNDLFVPQNGEYNCMPLHSRNNVFKEYMYSFMQNNQHILPQIANKFNDYIYDSLYSYDKNTALNLGGQYETVRAEDGITPVDICGIELKTRGELPIISDFMIAPTVNYYNTLSDDHGVTHAVKTPLVLTKGGHTMNFINDIRWNANINVPDDRNIPLYERILPGNMGIKYPYLTVGDFLQDKLIKVSYFINNTKFFSGFDGDFEYLLPIRKEYFNYFTLDNLREQLKIMKLTAGVDIELTIPVNGGSMIIKKIYGANDVVDCSINQSVSFDLGIFPFYKTNQADFTNGRYDKYCVIFGDQSQKMVVRFFRFGNLQNPVTNTNKKRGNNVTCYHIDDNNSDNRFDCIELTKDNVSGLVIPMWTMVDIAQCTRNFTYCVDFGTSNTHIAYSDGKSVKSFEITENDQQVVLLNSPDSKENSLTKYDKGYNAPSQWFNSVKNKQFMPSLITSGYVVKYPTRTATYETADLVTNDADIFGNVNIGFWLKNDDTQTETDSYFTDLKWAGVDSTQSKRILAYFKQTLWIIKNKILVNGGNPLSSKLIWTYPFAMKQSVVSVYRQQWNNAVQDVFGPNIVIDEKLEGVVPYYSFIATLGVQPAQDALNIDIGGGTFDMLFVANRSNRYYTTSALFAANDLWGDGVVKPHLTSDNGFLQMVKDLYDNNKILQGRANSDTRDFEVSNSFNYFISNEKFTSSDIIGFILGNDYSFQFTNALMQNKAMYSLLFVHYSAIMYHVAQILNSYNIEIPMYLGFTGMGSLYIKFISNSETGIANLSKVLLETFSGRTAPLGFCVKFTAHPKETTAEGGALSTNQDIKSITPDGIVNYAVDRNINKGMYYKNLNDDIKKNVLENFNHFIDILSSNEEIAKALSEFGISFCEKFVDELKRQAELSYDQVLQSQCGNPDDLIPETLFFWPLKQSIYEMTKKLWNDPNCENL